MKLFNRSKADTIGTQPTETNYQPEPRGHVHPNYRHLTWFRPSDSQTHMQ